MAGVAVADLVELVPVLVAAFCVVLGAIALVTGRQSFSARTPCRRWRDVVVPPVGAIERDGEGAR